MKWSSAFESHCLNILFAPHHLAGWIQAFFINVEGEGEVLSVKVCPPGGQGHATTKNKIESVDCGKGILTLTEDTNEDADCFS